MVEVSPAVKEFLSGARNAIMATLNRDGMPQLSPVWFTFDGQVFRISTTRDRLKYKNVRRDPRVSLCIDETGTPRGYVLVYGRAEATDHDILEPTREIVRKYAGEEAARQRTAERLAAERRVIVTVHPDKIYARGI